MTVAPVIVVLNLYIFMRIIVGNENLRNTFGAVGFQAAVDVVFTGKQPFMILYTWYMCLLSPLNYITFHLTLFICFEKQQNCKIIIF